MKVSFFFSCAAALPSFFLFLCSLLQECACMRPRFDRNTDCLSFRQWVHLRLLYPIIGHVWNCTPWTTNDNGMIVGLALSLVRHRRRTRPVNIRLLLNQKSIIPRCSSPRFNCIRNIRSNKWIDLRQGERERLHGSLLCSRKRWSCGPKEKSTILPWVSKRNLAAMKSGRTSVL